MKNLDYIPRPSWKYATIIDLGHINKLRMLRIRLYWGAWLEPVDPDVTFTGGIPPESELAKESELRESYIIDSPWSLLR